jgi:hypothetical protein
LSAIPRARFEWKCDSWVSLRAKFINIKSEARRKCQNRQSEKKHRLVARISTGSGARVIFLFDLKVRQLDGKPRICEKAAGREMSDGEAFSGGQKTKQLQLLLSFTPNPKPGFSGGTFASRNRAADANWRNTAKALTNGAQGWTLLRNLFWKFTRFFGRQAFRGKFVEQLRLLTTSQSGADWQPELGVSIVPLVPRRMVDSDHFPHKYGLFLEDSKIQRFLIVITQKVTHRGAGRAGTNGRDGGQYV